MIIRKGEVFETEEGEWTALTDGIVCPFCNGQYAALETPDSIGVWHSQPFCSQFENLSPDRFMESARLRREAGGPN